MVTAEVCRKMALAMDGVEEKPHFHKAAFRTNGKIFASLDAKKMQVAAKLPLVGQSVYCLIKPTIAAPAAGAWGRQGWTILDLNKSSKPILKEVLHKAYLELGPKKAGKTAVPKKVEAQIQTLHPDKNKANKKISLAKYKTIKDNLLAILTKTELTHTDLMESLYQRVKDSFEGGVQWYGETVKLDLEARKIIERTGTKPEKYQLRLKKS